MFRCLFFFRKSLKIKTVIYDFDCSGWMKIYNNFMRMVNVTMESNYVLIRAFFFFISHTLPDEVNPR